MLGPTNVDATMLNYDLMSDNDVTVKGHGYMRTDVRATSNKMDLMRQIAARSFHSR